VELEAYGIAILVGCTSGGFRVALKPKKAFLEQHLVPLVEEMLNSTGMAAGRVLGGLLETAFPLAFAIDGAVPDDPKLSKVVFTTCMRARIVLRGVGNVAHAVDVDVRIGGGKATVIDFARALAVTPDAAARRSGSTLNYRPLPRWDVLVDRLSGSGDAQARHSGSVLDVSMNMLPKILRVIADCARKGAPGHS
jgi:hypothetical protein